MAGLRELEEGLERASKGAIPEAVVVLAVELGVGDKPPQRSPRGPKKVKGPKGPTGPRLPYNIFRSADGLEVRVGRKVCGSSILGKG